MNDKLETFTYSANASTKICLEVPAKHNAFLTEKRYLSGYDIEDLTSKCNFIETLYLLFKHELPSKRNSQLLNALFVAFINPGPRDESVRASMAAGVSKTRPEHLLPIGLNVIGGENNGAQTVEHAYHFIQDHVKRSYSHDNGASAAFLKDNVKKLVGKVNIDGNISSSLCCQHLPGFYQHYGSVDKLTERLMESIFALCPNSLIFRWCIEFNNELIKFNLGISPAGVAAAVFLELELGARESIGLYQLLRAPGILAHGMEQTHKPITSIPMLKDDDYHFRDSNKGNQNE